MDLAEFLNSVFYHSDPKLNPFEKNVSDIEFCMVLTIQKFLNGRTKYQSEH